MAHLSFSILKPVALNLCSCISKLLRRWFTTCSNRMPLLTTVYEK
eukprot:CAMPEP_0185277168 /NCGR_PEP_ID=MMETSP1359-20130426/57992_1 /TAXON_ID=552665 /ORGANISM="Bigelowiella longifila, Strain CCMP242" /LENGTH=44 /DNA_ID= /DNA_START= /DNA_END= /DNA_ORIENTATION=